MTFDLVIRGGTVVTAEGSVRADVGVTGGRIAALATELGAEAAREVVAADGLLVLPGIIDVHTHTRVATDDEPDRFFQDSMAAAFGGTTTFLAFNNPGTGASEAAGRSLLVGLREWRERTEADSAIDYAVSLVVTNRHGDALDEIPRAIERGVPTFKAFMVYDFGVDDRTLFRLLGRAAGAGGMLEVHCEDRVLVEAAVEAALQRGDVLPRYHATTRTPEAEAVATHRAMEFARAAGAPVYVVHLSSAKALAEVARAKASGVRAFAETCPAYLALSNERYGGADSEAIRFIISPPLRSPGEPAALWSGLATGTLDLVGTDHVPDRLGREKALAADASFDRVSNGAPGIETLLALVHGIGVAQGRITIERMVQALATTPARLFGLRSKGAIEVGRDADLVLFDPTAARTIRAGDLHHSSDYTPYEGMAVRGAVRSVFVRGTAVIRDGVFVGRRGFGRFIERELDDRELEAAL
ncbi:MAG TPA: dihydropyrimidinase [Candidatus Limnocylindrales bacterium]